ncbi:uncharacterized protein STEHIDRAFT_86648 [Stereum hirsutum FP-91666 SS1]|uniref:uncharacterized protein n=1 Tax=Stereum hirsutum (strain FP-91666) TaxID=721885 RepID=UPI000444946D|nr:uncharacterized protein STEHIDRAFT_86648 [Stereum hirsutum FP-91666 SS1]EIM81296.1 hypothetical protein STEHIDRAFT_86648 [Stereum hirsutum FP-91666 SS1]
MAPTFLNAFLAAAIATAVSVKAESHTIKFDNQCGTGTPQLLFGGTVVSTGEDYTYEGALSSGIAYLQTGPCGYNGEYCTLVEMTLGNSACEGCGSSSDISLIDPHAFNVAAGFSYFNGCDGTGAYCSTADCSTAFFKSDDNQVQVECETDNVGLLISFCADGSGSSSSSSSSSSTWSSSSSSTPTSTWSSSSAAPTSSDSGVSVSVSLSVGLDAASATSSSAAAASSAAPTCSTKRKRASKARRESKRSTHQNHSRQNARRAHA